MVSSPKSKNADKKMMLTRIQKADGKYPNIPISPQG